MDQTIMTNSDPVVERPERFEDFFHREYRGMVALAAAVSGSRALGEDLAQEALWRAHRNWQTVSMYDKPGAWLRRVTINLASSARTRLRREVQAKLRLSSERTDAATGEPLDGDVWDAVRRLPAGQRSAVALFYLEDRSVADIAQIMGVAENTAKAHLHKARLALAAALPNQSGHSKNSTARKGQHE